jgi:hypothetical protein
MAKTYLWAAKFCTKVNIHFPQLKEIIQLTAPVMASKEKPAKTKDAPPSLSMVADQEL